MTVSNSAAGKTAIITGISLHDPLSTNIARALSSSGITHFGLIGVEQDHLDDVASSLKLDQPNLTILAQQVDITNPESLGIASHHIRSQLGAWDLFVHVPDAFGPTISHNTTIRGADEDEWWATFERNVRSIHFIARHFFPKMKPNSKFLLILSADDPAIADGELRDCASASEASSLAAARVLQHLARENPILGSHLVRYVEPGHSGSDAELGQSILQWSQAT